MKSGSTRGSSFLCFSMRATFRRMRSGRFVPYMLKVSPVGSTGMNRVFDASNSAASARAFLTSSSTMARTMARRLCFSAGSLASIKPWTPATQAAVLRRVRK